MLICAQLIVTTSTPSAALCCAHTSVREQGAGWVPLALVLYLPCSSFRAPPYPLAKWQECVLGVTALSTGSSLWKLRHNKNSAAAHPSSRAHRQPDHFPCCLAECWGAEQVPSGPRTQDDPGHFWNSEGDFLKEPEIFFSPGSDLAFTSFATMFPFH